MPLPEGQYNLSVPLKQITVENSMVQVWLSLGTKLTWLGLGKGHDLG